jgi:hypothetical protein
MSNRWLIAFACFAVALIGTTNSASSSDSNGYYRVHSSFSCGQYLQARQDEAAARAKVPNPRSDSFYSIQMNVQSRWIYGYISGLNSATDGIYNFLPFDQFTIELMVENACKANPTLSLAGSVQEVIYKSVGPTKWQREEPK